MFRLLTIKPSTLKASIVKCPTRDGADGIKNSKKVVVFFTVNEFDTQIFKLSPK